MNNGFTANGKSRLRRGQKELTTKSLAERYSEVEKKYAQLIAAAQPHQKEQIYQRMADELARLKNYEPSAYTLW